MIAGLGSALPIGTLTQPGALASAIEATSPNASEQNRMARIYKNAGVTARRSVLIRAEGNGSNPAPLADIYPHDAPPTTAERIALYQDQAPRLATAAAGSALQDASVPAEEVTHIVTASCTGAMSPGVDVQVIQALGLPLTTQRTHLGFMGCHAAINALRVAHAIAQSDASATVLGVCVELCTLHFQYTQRPDQVVSNALFGDAAGAFVVTGRATKPRIALRGTYSLLLPNTEDWMTWTIQSHGFEMTLARRVPQAIQEHVVSFVINMLEQHGLKLSDVSQILTHPGGPKVLDAVKHAFPNHRHAPASSDLLSTIGNVSSSTLLIALEQTPIDGPTVLLAFGPGLTFEAALLDLV